MVYSGPVYYSPPPPPPVVYSSGPVYYSSGPVYYASSSYSSTSYSPPSPTLPPISSGILRRRGDGQMEAKVSGDEGSAERWVVIQGAGDGRFTLEGGGELPDDVATEIANYYCGERTLKEYDTARLTTALSFLSHRSTLPADCIPRVSAAIARLGSSATSNERIRELKEAIDSGSLGKEEEDKGGPGGKGGSGKGGSGKGGPTPVPPPAKEAADAAALKEVERICKLDMSAATTTEADRAKMAELTPLITKLGKLPECLRTWYGGLVSKEADEKALAARKNQIETDIAHKQGRLDELIPIVAIFESGAVDKSKLKESDLARIAKLRDMKEKLESDVKALNTELTDGLAKEADRLADARKKLADSMRPASMKIHDMIPDDPARFSFAQTYGPTGAVAGWSEWKDVDEKDPPKEKVYTKSPLSAVQQKLVGYAGGPDFFVGVLDQLKDTFGEDEIGAQTEATKKMILGQAKRNGMKDDDIALLTKDANWFKAITDRATEHKELVDTEEAAERKSNPLFGLKLVKKTDHLWQVDGSDPARFFERTEVGGKTYVREIPGLTKLTDMPGIRLTDATRRDLFAFHVNGAIKDVADLRKNEAYFKREIAHFAGRDNESLKLLAAGLATKFKAMKGDKAGQKALASTVGEFFKSLPDHGRGFRSPWDSVTGGRMEVELVAKGGTKRRFFTVDEDGDPKDGDFVIGADDGKIYEVAAGAVKEITELASADGASGGPSGSGRGGRDPGEAPADGGRDCYRGGDSLTYCWYGRYFNGSRLFEQRKSSPSGATGRAPGGRSDDCFRSSSDGQMYCWYGAMNGGSKVYERQRGGGSSETAGSGGTSGGKAITGPRLTKLVAFLKNPRVGHFLNKEQMNSFITSVAPKYLESGGGGGGRSGTSRKKLAAADMDVMLALATALAGRHRGTLEKAFRDNAGKKGWNWFEHDGIKEDRDRKTYERLMATLSAEDRMTVDSHVAQVIRGNATMDDPCDKICNMWDRFPLWSSGQPDGFASFAKSDYDFAILSLQAWAAISTQHFCPDKVKPALTTILGKLKRYEKTAFAGKMGSGGGSSGGMGGGNDARNPYKSYGLYFALGALRAMNNSPEFKASDVATANPWLASVNIAGMEKSLTGHVEDLSNINWTGGSALHYFAMALVSMGISPGVEGGAKVKYTGPDGKQKNAGIRQMLKDKHDSTVATLKKAGVPDADLAFPYDISVGHTQIQGGVNDKFGGASRGVVFAISQWQADPDNAEKIDFAIRAFDNFVKIGGGPYYIAASGDHVHYEEKAIAPYYYTPGVFMMPVALVQLMKRPGLSVDQRSKMDALYPEVERLIAASHLSNGNFISPSGQFGNSVQWGNPMGIIATAALVNSCDGRPVRGNPAAVPLWSGGAEVASAAPGPGHRAHTSLAAPPPRL